MDRNAILSKNPRSEVTIFNDLLEMSSFDEINEYEKTLFTTKEYAPGYIDNTLNDTTLFKDPETGKYPDRNPRQMIENLKKRGGVDDILSVSFEVNNLGGRHVNMFYADFCHYLQNYHNATNQDFCEKFGRFHGNCAQYAAFMAIFLTETMPDLSPVLTYGDARVISGGKVERKRSQHFWLQLNNEITLDNSGILDCVYDDYRAMAYCEGFAQTEEPTWALDKESAADGGWFNKEVEDGWNEYVKHMSQNPLKRFMGAIGRILALRS